MSDRRNGVPTTVTSIPLVDPHAPKPDPSIGDLVKDATAQVSTLVRAEVALGGGTGQAGLVWFTRLAPTDEPGRHAVPGFAGPPCGGDQHGVGREPADRAERGLLLVAPHAVGHGPAPVARSRSTTQKAKPGRWRMGVLFDRA